MPLGPKLLIALGILAEGAYWVWLSINAHHGHYPVTFLGWTSLIGDPIAFVLFVIVGISTIVSNRKYRGTEL
jgi:hypothetical protein